MKSIVIGPLLSNIHPERDCVKYIIAEFTINARTDLPRLLDEREEILEGFVVPLAVTVCWGNAGYMKPPVGPLPDCENCLPCKARAYLAKSASGG